MKMVAVVAFGLWIVIYALAKKIRRKRRGRRVIRVSERVPA